MDYLPSGREVHQISDELWEGRCAAILWFRRPGRLPVLADDLLAVQLVPPLHLVPLVLRAPVQEEFVPGWENTFPANSLLAGESLLYYEVHIWLHAISNFTDEEELFFFFCMLRMERDHNQPAEPQPLILLQM